MSSERVPPFSVRTFHDRRSTYAVTVYVLNEGERIRGQLRRMHAIAATLDVIVVDGGSSDGSLDDAILKECNVRALLVKQGDGALSAQMRVGLHWCLAQGYEGIVTIDGNGKDDTAAIPKFTAALQQGYDHVQGSRYIPGGQGIRTPMLRHLGVKFLHAPAISLAAGARYTDTTNGFRAYSARFLRDDRVQPFRDVFQRYELHYYLAIRAARLGFRVVEVPVTREYPAEGTTPTKIRGFRGNVAILKTLRDAVSGKFDPVSRT